MKMMLWLIRMFLFSLAGLELGLWQESIPAGCFAFCALLSLEAIAMGMKPNAKIEVWG